MGVSSYSERTVDVLSLSELGVPIEAAIDVIVLYRIEVGQKRE